MAGVVTWFGWALVGWFAFDAAACMLIVGKERAPLTPGMALLAVVILVAGVVGALVVGTGHL